MSFISPNVNNVIYCDHDVTIGAPLPGRKQTLASPVYIVGANGREVKINGEEVNPDPEPDTLEWKSMLAFKSHDGATPVNLLTNTDGVTPLPSPIGRVGYQTPEILLLPRSASQAQVFIRGSMTGRNAAGTGDGGFYAGGTCVNLPVETAPAGGVPRLHGYAPPGTGKLHFINAGDDDNQFLGCLVHGATAASNPSTIENALGGTHFAFDGLSWFVDYVEPE